MGLWLKKDKENFFFYMPGKLDEFASYTFTQVKKAEKMYLAAEVCQEKNVK